MRAIALNNYVDRPALVAEEIPQPQAGPGDLLIKVYAAGVISAELGWEPTTHTKSGGKHIRAIPCHEFSGVISTVGEQVTDFHVGQEVYGMNDWYAEGALAEYCLAPPSDVAPKPARLTHIEAASVPISALTAWQGLFERAKIQAGERLLVHGGAGGVGVFVIQLARLRGVHVIATVSARNRDFVMQLGAEQTIDYHAERFEESVHDVDVVFDAVGGETLRRSWSVLKPGGRMVTIASTSEADADERTKRAFFIVEPNQKQLIEIGKLLDSGKLKTYVDVALPLSEAPAAFAGKVKRSQGRGKVVIAVASQANASGTA